MEKIAWLGVVVVAGGVSKRYGSNKLMEDLGGMPLFCHALKNYSVIAGELVLVTSACYDADYRAALAEYLPDLELKITLGGEVRAESVRNGLEKLSGNIRYVAICDAARPLGKASQLAAMVDVAEKEHCGVISGRYLTDSLKQVDASGMIVASPKRDCFFRAETPQLFPVDVIKKALSMPDAASATDDAEAVCRTGYPVKVLPDGEINLKVTRKQDGEILRKSLFFDK